ncbi:HNH endonuclease [uncultured Paraglaciecola sp.]|uniref:HNH endonuclease n=1 Tax=uncultured Paraglaciecola sp. TaxID=1765024 RepID=UPI0026140B5A|nr:HNH endonuclease [uncultured Paraglaciecola sp.]
MVCRIQHKQPDPQLCLNCGCCFSAIKWFKGRNKATRVAGAKTCSHRCNIEWIKRNPERKKKISNAFQGKKHPNWQGGSSRGVDGGYRGPGWAAIAEKARKRDGYVCQDCGITQEAHGKALEVHHKIPFNQYQGGNTKANRMSNLTTLCKSCHTTADWKWRRENAVQVIMSFDAA